mmetsp:Transcript_12661/g.23732  ORF Transcript_12661/g.23732 Transcript_12661/m.23732 type:complete len:168 (-) Transcript_12661:88-591(-)
MKWAWSLTLLIAFIFPLLHCVNAGKVEDVVDDLREKTIDSLQPLFDKFDDLPPKGKFGVSAIGGFAITKISMRTTIKVVKVGGAAFIMTEVLHQAGVLDDFSYPSDSSHKFILGIRQKIASTVNECRITVRKHLNVDNMRQVYKSCLQNEKMGTLGFTTGAVAGLLL